MANHPKLTPTQVEELKRLYEQEGVSQAALAKQFGVSVTTIRVKLGLHPQNKPKPQPEVVDCECDEFDPRPPDVIEQEGPGHYVDCEVNKKKEPPKRRIVGVNI